MFITLGAYEDEAQNTLELRRNYWTDVQAVREYLAPERYVSWYRRDFDLEIHEVNLPPGEAGRQMVRRILVLSDNFEQNARAERPEYTPEDRNCSAWVNTILKILGVPEEERERLGEFDGIDWGEEDLLEESLFQTKNAGADSGPPSLSGGMSPLRAWPSKPRQLGDFGRPPAGVSPSRPTYASP